MILKIKIQYIKYDDRHRYNDKPTSERAIEEEEEAEIESNKKTLTFFGGRLLKLKYMQ